MKNLIFLLLITSFAGCKKDKLKDEAEFLIGTWNWTHTTHQYNLCDEIGLEEILSPDSESENYSMIFKKKGIVEFYKNLDFVEKSRIVFDHFEINELGNFVFVINLNNNEDTKMSGFGNEALLNFGRFPFLGIDSCEDYDNYFSKE